MGLKRKKGGKQQQQENVSGGFGSTDADAAGQQSDGKNQQNIKDIGADNVTQRQSVIPPDRGGDCDGQLGPGCSNSDQSSSYYQRGETQRTGSIFRLNYK